MNPRYKDLQSFILALENLQTECTVRFYCFCCGIIRWVIYQQNRIRDFESFVDQATPGFELGKKDLQSPALPLGHIAKTIQKNRWKISRLELDYWTSFFVLVSWILFFLILFRKESLSPFWLDLIHPFDWLYSISKHTMPKNFPSPFFILKSQMWIFSHKRKTDDKFEPLTIGCWLRIHERALNLNLKLCFPNDIRKKKLIHN